MHPSFNRMIKTSLALFSGTQKIYRQTRSHRRQNKILFCSFTPVNTNASFETLTFSTNHCNTFWSGLSLRLCVFTFAVQPGISFFSRTCMALSLSKMTESEGRNASVLGIAFVRRNHMQTKHFLELQCFWTIILPGSSFEQSKHRFTCT